MFPKRPHDAAKREVETLYSGWRVDLVILDDGDHAGEWEPIVAIIEFKGPDLEGGPSQLHARVSR